MRACTLSAALDSVVALTLDAGAPQPELQLAHVRELFERAALAPGRRISPSAQDSRLAPERRFEAGCTRLFERAARHAVCWLRHMPLSSLHGRTRRLPVLERNVVMGAASKTEHIVFCSAREQTVPLGTCEACPHLIAPPHQARPGGVVTCAPPPRSLDASDFSDAARFDAAEAGAHTRVAEILGRCAVFVTPNASLDSAIDLFESGADCVPIVDDAGKLTGVLRPSDVLGASKHLRCCDLRTPPSRLDVVRESLPIGLAFAVLADSGHSALPVVNESGTVIGILSALDLTRWVARRMGHVVG